MQLRGVATRATEAYSKYDEGDRGNGNEADALIAEF